MDVHVSYVDLVNLVKNYLLKNENQIKCGKIFFANV